MTEQPIGYMCHALVLCASCTEEIGEFPGDICWPIPADIRSDEPLGCMECGAALKAEKGETDGQP